VVVNEIFSAGDANRGVQTAAYNLPNDDRVTEEKGTKRVMLKNVQDAKFAKTLVPISRVVLSPADQAHISFDAFFTHIVVHELMHGLGPHNITVGGRQTNVRQELNTGEFISGLAAKQNKAVHWELPTRLDEFRSFASMSDIIRPGHAQCLTIFAQSKIRSSATTWHHRITPFSRPSDVASSAE